MTTHVDAETVAKVAALARLDLQPAELADVQARMSAILTYVGGLAAVPTDDVEPLAHAIPLANVFREDVVTPSLPREAALQNAPRTDGLFFSVPEILGGG